MQLTRKPFKAGLYSLAINIITFANKRLVKYNAQKYVYAKSYYVSFGIMLIYCIFDALAISLLPG